MKKSRLAAFVFAGLVFAMVSCSKSSTGPTGATGATGPAGPDSVYHSAWTAVNMTFQGVDTTGGANDSIWTQAISTQSITQNVLDSDLVLTYFYASTGLNGSGTPTVLEASDLSLDVDVEYSVGSIQIVSYGFDFAYNGVTEIRFVIIPGSVLVTNSVLKGMTKAQIKASSYSVISSALGISDKTTPK
jgi:hypothetical protein